MRIYQKLLFISVMIFISGCTSVSVKMPAVQLEPPETQGETGRFNVSGGIHGSNEVVLIPDATERPPRIKAPYAKGAALVNGGGAYSVTPKFDLGLKILSNGTMKICGKYQLMGPSAQEYETGLVLTPMMMIGGHQSSQDDQDLITKTTSHTDATEGLLDAGLLTGYRINRELTVYQNTMYSSAGYKGTVDQKTLSNSQSYDFSGSVDQVTIGFGAIYRFRNTANLIFELAHGRLYGDKWRFIRNYAGLGVSVPVN